MTIYQKSDRSFIKNLVAKEKNAASERAKAYYFEHYGHKEFFDDSGDDFVAPAQCCNLQIRRSDCHPHHKIKRSLGGSDDLENYIIFHPRCHAWVHSTNHTGNGGKLRVVAESPINVITGGKVKWPEELKLLVTQR